MTNIEPTCARILGPVLFGLAFLSAPGLAGAHGAPDVEGVPEGIVKARITQQPDIPGLSAIILDAPRPGILLRYQGEETLTVLGTEGEDFLTFSQTDVTANPDSPSWQALPNVAADAENADPIPLSGSGSFGWLDPRLNALADVHNAGNGQDWKIRIRTASGDMTDIGGTLTYVPLSQNQ
jgi:hypothetical protein